MGKHNIFVGLYWFVGFQVKQQNLKTVLLLLFSRSQTARNGCAPSVSFESLVQSMNLSKQAVVEEEEQQSAGAQRHASSAWRGRRA